MHKTARFDWSTLDRQSLYDMLWETRKEIINKKLSPTKIRNLLNKQIKKSIPVRVYKKADVSVESGWIYVGGTYYSEYDKSKKICIDVNFAYSPFDEHIILTRNKFSRICKSFADVILHEIIHMRQYRRRKFKIIPDYESNAEMDELRREQRYLGCDDEIDAYAFNIACELLDKCNNNKKQMLKYINYQHKNSRIKSTSLKSYLKAFEYDHNHPVIKKLKKKVIRYIPNAELGKPYKNKDWISH